jgi:hypothetical protein
VVDLRDHYRDDGHDRNHDDHWGDDDWKPVLGMIPVGYAPSSVVLDPADNALLVSNDKGLGTTGYGVAPPPTNTAENSYATEFGVNDLNTHQDLGTVSIVPVPKFEELWALTKQVFQNNHWDLFENIFSAAGGDRHHKPVAIPEKIGDPSKIKHVFVIIRENRTYDQMLGDVAAGNGDATLAVFGDNATYGVISPNAHALVQRFPLLDTSDSTRTGKKARMTARPLRVSRAAVGHLRNSITSLRQRSCRYSARCLRLGPQSVSVRLALCLRIGVNKWTQTNARISSDRA